MLTIKAFLHTLGTHTQKREDEFSKSELRIEHSVNLFCFFAAVRLRFERFYFHATWSTIEMSKMRNSQKDQQTRDNACTEQK